MLTVNSEIAVEVINSDELTDELIKYYYPLLSSVKKQEISAMEDPENRCLILLHEIAARRAAAELNGCAADRLSFSSGPLGCLSVDKDKGFVRVGIFGNTVCAVASKHPVGLGLAPVEPFSFRQAQQNLSDSEVRAVVAASGYSLMDIVNAKQCSKQSAAELYAQLIALKNARLCIIEASESKKPSNASFSSSGGVFTCSDRDFDVLYSTADRNYRLAVAVIKQLSDN